MNSPRTSRPEPQQPTPARPRQACASGDSLFAIRHSAFTLIELMVVVAIIALLIGILLPSFNTVRIQAKNVDTEAWFQALEQGNEQFRGDRAIGGQYVPSQTDCQNAPPYKDQFGMINDPLEPDPGFGSNIFGPITGASLLVYGLAGADRLGTAGFRDLDISGIGMAAGLWFDDQGNNGVNPPGPYQGSYYLNTGTLEPAQPRYGPYVDDKAISSRIWSFDRLIDEGVIVSQPDQFQEQHSRQLVFVDAFDQPILYYRARRAATWMINDPVTPNPGVYDHRDNDQITGSSSASVTGVDFGAGTAHELDFNGTYPGVDPDGTNGDLTASTFDNSFARFIWDPNVTQRNTPVNRETFLLISAGYDGLYGTTDDITNWTRSR